MKGVLDVEEGDVGGVNHFIGVYERLVCGLTGQMFSDGKQEVWRGCEDIEGYCDGGKWDEAKKCRQR